MTVSRSAGASSRARERGSSPPTSSSCCSRRRWEPSCCGRSCSRVPASASTTRSCRRSTSSAGWPTSGRTRRPASPSATTSARSSTSSSSRNVPGRGRGLLHLRRRRALRASFAPSLEERRLAPIDASPPSPRQRRGEFEQEDETRFRYVAVPVRTRSGRPRGVFAVVIDLSDELDEVNEALQIAVGVNIGVLILASMLAWVIAGRVLAAAPAAARHRAQHQRVGPHPPHPGRKRRRAGRPRAHLQRDARPPRGGVRAARRRSSATPATSCAPRSRSSAATST